MTPDGGRHALLLDVVSGAAPGDADARRRRRRSPSRARRRAAARSPSRPRPALPARGRRRGAAGASSETAELLRALGHDGRASATRPTARSARRHRRATCAGIARRRRERCRARSASQRRTRGFARLGPADPDAAARLGAARRGAHARAHQPRSSTTTTCCSCPSLRAPPVAARRSGRARARCARCSGWSRVYPFTARWNRPASRRARCPAGFTDDGLPLGVQLGRPPERRGHAALARRPARGRAALGGAAARPSRSLRAACARSGSTTRLRGELRALEPREPGKVGHLRLRADRLRRASTWATRARSWSSRCSSASSSTRATRSTLVENVTDVNDKIYDAARERGRAERRARRAR